MRYIVNFSFEQVQGNRNDEGSFQILLDAVDVEAAVASARGYLVEYQGTRRSDLFDGNVTLYLDSIVELNNSLTRPVLLDYTSRESEPGPRASLHCDVVDDSDGIKSYGWAPDGVDPEGDEGHEIEAFLTFGNSDPPPWVAPRAGSSMAPRTSKSGGRPKRKSSGSAKGGLSHS